MKKTLFLISLLVFVISSASVFAAFGSLDGYVTDSVTGNGVYGAQVKVWLGGTDYVTTYSMAGGYFLFNNDLPAGSGYQIFFSKANYNSLTLNCPEICSGCRKSLNAVLPAKDGTGVLEGHVTACDTGQPLENVNIVASTYSMVTDSNGFYHIRLAKGNNHTLRATYSGYPRYDQSGITVPGSNNTQ